MANPATRSRAAIPIEVELKPREEPLYRRIFVALEQKIYNGDFPGGSYLPSEAELAKHFNVSRITAIRALNDLEATGLVVREKGRGTLVHHAASGVVIRGPAEEGSAVAPPMTLNEVTEEHRTPERSLGHITVLDVKLVPAPRDIAAVFGVPAGRKLHRSARLLQFEGEPYAYVVTYLRPGLGEGWTREDVEKTSLNPLLRRAGIVIQRKDDDVAAVAADASLAKLLRVPNGSPLLRVVRTAFDADERPIERTTAFHLSSRYRYAVSVLAAPRRP